MDQELIDLVKPDGLLARSGKDVQIRFVDLLAAEIEIEMPGEPVRYKLKSLRDLYGPGNNVDVVDPQNDTFMPLFLMIEEEIAKYYLGEMPRLTDGSVGLVLNQLGMDPEAATSDPFTLRIQMALRMCLSLNSYSPPGSKVGSQEDREIR
ncbi:MAG TPA: hypothetical protein VLJ39_12050 [Tepidisphaeraceae bacterium]|nr:hypothetical protein [Tepidisphaeraceae bacterium]